jgi:NADH-quinone oxidoreductase subunit F
MLEILTNICEGRGDKEDIDTLIEISETVKEASLCGLGKTAPNPIISTIKYFKEEYLEHINNRRCPAGVCKPLTNYYIDEDSCRGCGACKRSCPESAISGEVKKVYKIDESKCIKCANCINTCSFDAVRVR